MKKPTPRGPFITVAQAKAGATTPPWKPQTDGELARLRLACFNSHWVDFWLGVIVIEPQAYGRR